MSDAKGLLERIATLKTRLAEGPASANVRQDPTHRVEEMVQQGAWHNHLLDRALRPLDAPVDSLPPRLTARGARLLKKGKELLQALRALTEDPILQADDHDPLTILHRDGAALIEVLLRTIQAFPPAPSAQLRLCEGLEIVLQTAEEQLNVLVA